ncbi:MAG: hypothetical protein K2G45_04195 [Lachnospiraceae bacterium]|nr:hypothetical protein [Lachnospiraceae bacterium]
MKKKLLDNLGLKIISVVVAIIFWLVVMNISDYTMTVRIDNIPVQQINGEVLANLDQVYDIASGDTVDIVVRGRRSIVSKLSKDDFVAVADLSKMSITNTVQIFVNPKSASISDDISITYVDNTMKLNLEEKVSAPFPIKAVTKGNPIDGYAVGDIEVKPNIVTIEGPKSAVDKITEVRATVNADGIRSQYEVECDIQLYDAYGEEIMNDKLSLSLSKVNIIVNVYPVKAVPINVSVKGTPGDGYDIGGVVYQPQTVRIAGPTDKLSKVSSIDINDISVSGLTENVETMLNINDYLPSGVFVAQDNPEVAISIRIEKLENVAFNINPNDINLIGKNNRYTYKVELSDGYNVVVSGLSDVVKEIDASSLKPSIDCSKLSVGINNNVTLDLMSIDGITYSFSGSVTVVVEER